MCSTVPPQVSYVVDLPNLCLQGSFVVRHDSHWSSHKLAHLKWRTQNQIKYLVMTLWSLPPKYPKEQRSRIFSGLLTNTTSSMFPSACVLKSMTWLNEFCLVHWSNSLYFVGPTPLNQSTSGIFKSPIRIVLLFRVVSKSSN